MPMGMPTSSTSPCSAPVLVALPLRSPDPPPGRLAPSNARGPSRPMEGPHICRSRCELDPARMRQGVVPPEENQCANGGDDDRAEVDPGDVVDAGDHSEDKPA